MNTDNHPLPAAQTPIDSSAPVAICFFGLAFGGLFLALAILLRRPDLLLPESHGPEVLVTRHLLMSAWIGSFFFGAAYWMGPSLAAARLWRPGLAWTHFVLHAVGIPWLLIGLAAGARTEAAVGGVLLIAGVLLFALNLMNTEAVHNRWTPANGTLVAALFWLVLSAGLPSLGAFRAEEPVGLAATLHAMHFHAALIGFMWLGVVACVLRFVTMFTPGDRREGLLTWIGLALVNLGLFALPAIGQSADGESVPNRVPDLLIVAGSLMFVMEALRLYLSTWRNADTAVAAAVAGLVVVSLELLRAVLGGRIEGMVVPAVIAGMTLSLVGLTMGLVPLLIWRLRCARPDDGAAAILQQSRTLLSSRMMLAPLIAGVAGCGYFLGFGFTGHPVAIQLGALLLLISAAWALVVIHPALETFWHARQPNQDSVP